MAQKVFHRPIFSRFQPTLAGCWKNIFRMVFVFPPIFPLTPPGHILTCFVFWGDRIETKSNHIQAISSNTRAE